MLGVSPEIITLIMFGGVLTFILLGYPIAFALAGVSAVVGVLTMGKNVFYLFQMGVDSMLNNYVLLAIPLFIFMGNMIQEADIAKRAYDAIYIWFGKLRGGLAIVTIIVGVILAACTGVIAASVIMLGLIAIPEMLERGYDKKLACGSICAGGSLGILIPPSLMIIVYGPIASLSVGKLFTAAYTPGIMLSIIYILYIIIKCKVRPELAPIASAEEEQYSFKEKLVMLLKSVAVPLILVLAVLGSITFGIASATEAAAVGALASILIAAFYKKLTLKGMKRCLIDALKVTAIVQLVSWGAKMFTVLYLRLGCDAVVTNLITSVPFGKWGSFALIMFILFILGMFIDWIGIVYIMVPIMTPVAVQLGFDPIWFAMMVIVNLQLSFISPPFAQSIFYLNSILKEEWGIKTIHIIKGIAPYMCLVAFVILLCTIFPNIILWLPNLIYGN